jgi:uncharacterized protein with beta-barrel porin domain
MRKNLFAALALVALGAAAPAMAQAPLVDAAGGNPTKASLATNIVGICPELVNRLTAGTSASPDEADLANRCRAAVFAANSGATGTANATLGQIAAEEIITQEAAISGASNDQSRALASRLAALGGAGPAAFRVAHLYQAGTASDAQTPVAPSGRAGRFDGWATGAWADGEKDATALESAFDTSGWSLLVGADYGLSDTLTIGGAVGYADSESDFGGGGSMDASTITLAAYGVYGIPSGLYASGLVAVNFIEFDSKRVVAFTEAPSAPNATTVNRIANSSTDGLQYEATGAVGYDWPVGGFTVSPVATLSYRRLEVDGFTETGAQGLDLRFGDQETDSLLTSLGGDAVFRMSTGFGVVSPFLHAAWEYEFLDDSRTIDANYRVDPFIGTARSPVIRIHTDSPDRSRLRLGAGATALFANGIQAFLSYDTVLDLDDVTLNTVAIGLRKEF